MLEKDKWYKLTLSFQLKVDFNSVEEYLRLWGKIGKSIGIEGLVADVEIREVQNVSK